MARPRNTVSDFWAKVARRGPEDCWLWTGAPDSDGYGWFSFEGRRWRVHRLVYVLTFGSIPDWADHIHHRCEVRLCVNPAHLEPKTALAHLLLGNYPGVVNARKTTCPKCGGPYTTAPSGRRRCRPCKAAWTRARAAA